MVVGVMQVELAIDWAQSLKDKRRVVRSLKDSLHRHHMVSVAEVANLEIHNRASMGVSLCSNSGEHAGVTLDRVLERIRAIHDAELVSTSREILHCDFGDSTNVQADMLNQSQMPRDLMLDDEMTNRAVDALNEAITNFDDGLDNGIDGCVSDQIGGDNQTRTPITENHA
jgi:uncharacterized protein